MFYKRCLLSAVIMLLPQLAMAAVVQFDVTLDGAQAGTASPGTGSATAFFDDASGAMSISGMFAGLNGTSTNAHLHGLTTNPGTGTAGVLIPLTFTSGVTAGSFSGNGTIASGNIAGTLAGRTYINIHSSTNGGGEIRGFLLNPISVPEPGSFAALCVLAAGAAMKRRRRR